MQATPPATTTLSAVCATRQSYGGYGALVFGAGVSYYNRYGTLVPLWTNFTKPQASLPGSGPLWNSCWVNSGSYGEYLVVGSNGQILLGANFLNATAITVNNGSSSQIYTSVTCLSPTDCIAVGLSGAVVSGSKSSPTWTQVIIDSKAPDLFALAALPAGSLRLGGLTAPAPSSAFIVDAATSTNQAFIYCYMTQLLFSRFYII